MDVIQQAKTLIEGDQPSVAIPLLLSALESLPETTSEQLNVRWWLARAYYDIEHFERARQLFTDLLTDATRILGPTCDLSYGCKRWLADVDHLLGQYKLAQKWYEEIFSHYEARYGEKHDYFLCLQHWIARNLHCLGRYEEAQVYFQRPWIHFPVVYGEAAPFLLEHQSWWAANEGALGNLRKEADMEWQILEQRIKRKDTGEALLWAFANLRDTLESLDATEELCKWEICRVECGLPSEPFE